MHETQPERHSCVLTELDVCGEGLLFKFYWLLKRPRANLKTLMPLCRQYCVMFWHHVFLLQCTMARGVLVTVKPTLNVYWWTSDNISTQRSALQTFFMIFAYIISQLCAVACFAIIIFCLLSIIWIKKTELLREIFNCLFKFSPVKFWKSQFNSWKLWKLVYAKMHLT